MTVINTNIKALYTQSALKVSERDSAVAMQQLATGKRINSSKDDAAGLAIATRMTQNIKGMNQAIRNSGDAISLIQVAEGATNEITYMLQRMSELAVQSSNSTYSTEQRGYLDQEFQQLKQEIVRISETHEWNGFPILNGKAGTPVGLPTTVTATRAVVAATGTGKALETGDLEIQTDKGSYAVPASTAAADSKSNTIAAGSNNAGSAIAIAAAINSQVGITGVSAVAGAATIGATKTSVGSTSIQTDLYVNGEKVSLSLSASHTLSQRRQYVMDSINAGTTVHGVLAGNSGIGGLTLTTPDGRNLSVWYDSTSVQGSDFGLGLDTTPSSNPLGVTGVSGKGNVGDIVTSPVLSVTSTPGAAAVAVAATTAGVGTTQVEVRTYSLTALRKGQSVTFGGLTFTGGTGGASQEQVTAAFASIAGTSATSAQTFTQANSNAGGFVSDSIGKFTSGTAITGGTFTAASDNGSVSWTAAISSNTQAIQATLGNPTISFDFGRPWVVETTPKNTAVKQVQNITIYPLVRGQSISLGGLTFTSGSSGTTAAQLKAAFVAFGATGASADQTVAEANAAANTAVSDAIGRFTFGTSTARGTYSSGTGEDELTFTATATDTDIDLDATGGFSTGGPLLPQEPWIIGKSPRAQVSTATFTALEAGASVTFAGLTFTSGTAGTTAEQLKTAFASIGTSSATVTKTAAEVNTLANTAVSDAIGRFTSGTTITGGTFAAGGTGQVTWTATTNSDTQIALASTGSVESSVLTFSALKTGQSFNLNGLGFTAKKDLTSAEVASAFGSLISGTSTTPANTANGNYSGSWTAGYSTGAATGATVTATAAAAGTNNIEFSSSNTETVQGSTVAASTVYGTVTLNSQNAFTIKPGAKAYASAPALDPTYANFTALGFEAKTINAKDIGRLSFQVGHSPDQLIHIDFADFGKNGDITGAITSDRAPTNILTVQAANDVTQSVNKSLDMIAQTRASMGAVMNRLEHVIDNLTNVVMNSEASRSQIEDADYAKASTELAKTQIQQQAATAVLSQANLNSQMVLKLLEQN